MQLAG